MDWRRVFFRCTILRHFLARPRGVLSETYRYEEISLFPKDLNENYHPSDFAEKVVDPKSFRNILTSTLGWTVSFVLAFFLVVQLTYTRETIRHCSMNGRSRLPRRRRTPLRRAIVT